MTRTELLHGALAVLVAACGTAGLGRVLGPAERSAALVAARAQGARADVGPRGTPAHAARPPREVGVAPPARPDGGAASDADATHSAAPRAAEVAGAARGAPASDAGQAELALASPAPRARPTPPSRAAARAALAAWDALDDVREHLEDLSAEQEAALLERLARLGPPDPRDPAEALRHQVAVEVELAAVLRPHQVERWLASQGDAVALPGLGTRLLPADAVLAADALATAWSAALAVPERSHGLVHAHARRWVEAAQALAPPAGAPLARRRAALERAARLAELHARALTALRAQLPPEDQAPADEDALPVLVDFELAG